MRRSVTALLFVILAASQLSSEPKSATRIALGVNLFQIGFTALGSSFFSEGADGVAMYILPIDAHFLIHRPFGIGVSFVDRYEKEGTLRKNLMSFSIGPRLTFLGRGSEGLYITARMGFGIDENVAASVDQYRDVDWVLQPEIGYSHLLGNSHLFLEYGAGFLILVPIIQSYEKEYNALGDLVHYYMPMLKISLGVAL